MTGPGPTTDPRPDPVGGVRIARAGWSTTVQDGGRPGFAHLGVGRSGRADPAAASRVLRALGLDDAQPVIESAGGLVLEALRPTTVLASSWSGPISLRPGDTVAVEPHRGSNWVVVAVAGGLVVPSLLGSCSADTLGGIIPFPVTDGVEIPVGVPAEPVTAISDLAIVPRRGDRAVVSPGPRVDWFVEGALGELWRSTWTVTASSRIGVRLDGPVIARVDERELPSEGLVAGAVQIPPDGHPIVMGPDHPVTGGYPVIGIVRAADLAMVLDRPVGSRIGFLPP